MKVSFKFLDDFISPWRAYVAEFLGTLLFVFISTAVVVADSLYGGVGKVGEALAIGLLYLTFVYSTVNLSGGYLNPAITLSLWLSQKVSGAKAVGLVMAQILASVGAALVVFLVFGAWAEQFTYGMPSLGLGIGAETAIALEAILTASLVFVVFATTVDNKGPVSFGPLTLGALVGSISLVFGPLTGGIANVARIVGPAVFSGSYSQVFIYVMGGLIGSLFALIYEMVFLKKSSRK